MKKATGLLVILLMALFVFSTSATSSEIVVLSGTINDESQLVTETGQVYEIGENEKGMELMEMEGSKVEVKGKIVKDPDDEDAMVLMVTEFKVIT